MKKPLLLIGVALALTACGGGSSTTPTNPATPTIPTTPSSGYNKQQTERLYGSWQFTYTIISTYTDRYKLRTIHESTATPGDFYLDGVNESGDIVVAGYFSDTKRFALYDPGSVIDQFYTFDFTGTNSVSGCYYLIQKSTSKISSCYAMNGTRYSTSSASLGASGEDKLQMERQQLAAFTPGSVPANVWRQYEQLKAIR